MDRDPLRQAVICPGASLVMPREGAMRTPPVLEVLAWHFIRVLGHVQPFPTDHQPLTDLLKKYYYSDTCVRLIPLRESLNPSKQGAYDWLADVRDQYGLSGDELAGQTIMSLQGNDPSLVDQLYPAKDCHFRPSIAQKAIGLLLGRASTEMMRTHPNSVHVLVVCSWNVKGQGTLSTRRCMLRPSYVGQNLSGSLAQLPHATPTSLGFCGNFWSRMQRIALCL